MDESGVKLLKAEGLFCSTLASKDSAPYVILQLIQLRLNLGCSDYVGCEQLKHSIAQLSTWGSAFPSGTCNKCNKFSSPREHIVLVIARIPWVCLENWLQICLFFDVPTDVSRCQRKYTTYQDLSYSRSDRLARDAFFQHLLRAGGPRRPKCCRFPSDYCVSKH